jgi:hypothetical protein
VRHIGHRYFLKNLLEPFDNPQVRVVPGNKETFMVKEVAEEKDAIPLYSGKAPIFIQEGSIRHNCSGRILMYQSEGPERQRLGKVKQALGYVKGTEGYVDYNIKDALAE